MIELVTVMKQYSKWQIIYFCEHYPACDRGEGYLFGQEFNTLRDAKSFCESKIKEFFRSEPWRK